MRMMLVILFFVFFFTSCEHFARQTYTIRIRNESSQIISVYGEYILPDTSLPEQKPSLRDILPHESGLIYGHEVNDDDFERMENEQITVFIFSKDTIDQYDWATIKKDYKILKRSEFNNDELTSMGGALIYP